MKNALKCMWQSFHKKADRIFMNTTTLPTKRNHSISYVKGCAILGVILIHLFDWSEIAWSPLTKNFKEFLYPFVMMFLATAGSVMVIANQRHDFLTGAKRAVKRALEIFAVYFVYNLGKILIYNFDQQPFFKGFEAQGTLTFSGILTFKAFSVPITILLTIAFFVMVSPIILLLIKKTRHPKIWIMVLISALIVVDYAIVWPSNSFVDFVFAKKIVTFPIALWAIPFLIGMLLALYDIDKTKFIQIPIWFVLTIVCFVWWKALGHNEWQPSAAMYPLHLYYVAFSFFYMSVLIVLFSRLEKIRSKSMAWFLSILQVLGDNTLELYILHWLVIDVASWILYPNLFWIWLFVPLFLAGFVFWHRRKVSKLYETKRANLVLS